LTTAYVDASALVKLVQEEDESGALRRYLGTRDIRAASCDLNRVETMRAVRRGAPRLVREAAALLDEVQAIAVTRDVLDLAGRMEPPELRTIDAIHLATASRLERDLDAVVTYDRRMQRAAGAMGMTVQSPA
jgi:predicted nucleic acid-binding protein